MGRKLFNGVTLWLGMYTITATLFYIETNSLRTALLFALLGSSLKTVWSLTHKTLTHRPAPTPAALTEEAVTVSECECRQAA